jgi:phosphatidylserine/phosphatidylglycerophosphate/cardiolipin synthase-like enzyme
MPVEVTFLEQGGQRPETIAALLADFLAAARVSLDIAIYDFRLGPALAAPVRDALQSRVAAGVAVRVAYDGGKRTVPFQQNSGDPAPPGTADFIAHLGPGLASKPITGGDPHFPRLMHHKYIVRDGGTAAAALWTGSVNFTDDSWTLQENNLLRIPSPELCAYYTTDFEELWRSGDIGTTGAHDTGTVAFNGTTIEVAFAPGDGPSIDHEIAQRIGAVRRRLRICSMLVNSGAILGSLCDVLKHGRVPDYRGIYDRTQMESVLQQWQGTPSAWKIQAFRQIAAPLAGKRSTPYTPTSPHDFMHNKVVVADDTVITGSYNLSHSATENAENVLMITDPALADRYVAWIDQLVSRYGSQDGKEPQA